jgi:hypothetical protein
MAAALLPCPKEEQLVVISFCRFGIVEDDRNSSQNVEN